MNVLGDVVITDGKSFDWCGTRICEAVRIGIGPCRKSIGDILIRIGDIPVIIQVQGELN